MYLFLYLNCNRAFSCSDFLSAAITNALADQATLNLSLFANPVKPGDESEENEMRPMENKQSGMMAWLTWTSGN